MAVKKTQTTSRELSNDIIDTVREPLIVLDKDLRVVSAGRSFYELFKAQPENTVGKLIYDLGNKQWDIPKLRELLETILPQKAAFDNYEVEHDFTTIGKRIMLLNARRIPRPPEEPKVILLAIEDITERKRLEKILKESEERYRRAFETSLDGLLLLDKQTGNIVDNNPAAAKILGYSGKDLLGKNLDDIGILKDTMDFKKDLEKIERSELVSYKDVPITKRGGMLINADIYLIDRAKVAQLNIRDVTERKKIEDGMEKTRNELGIIRISEEEALEYAESIIDTVREPLIVLDQDLRVVSVSRSFYELFKVKTEETVGQLIYDLGNRQWDIPKLRDLLEDILPKKAAFDNYVVEHNFSTIGKRIMLLNARQVQRVLGKERIILLAIEDITERREIENGLKKAHEDLKELATELKRTSRVKSEFLANMSHELRTPLNSINGFSEVLYDETFGLLNEKQKKYVNNVLTSGKHLLLLINQILDMAKVEAGKMKLVLSRLPMKILLKEISLLVEDMVSKKKIDMLLELADDLPDIEADELKVKEIIYNLLSNAVKFTPDGGKIGIRASAKKANSEIEVVVWDTGVGIAPENMEKIFEGFFRVDTPYSRVTEGTGLGLPLSRKLVELHGGKLFAQSEGLNCGTSIRFTLPIVSEGV